MEIGQTPGFTKADIAAEHVMIYLSHTVMVATAMGWVGDYESQMKDGGPSEKYCATFTAALAWKQAAYRVTADLAQDFANDSKVLPGYNKKDQWMLYDEI